MDKTVFYTILYEKIKITGGFLWIEDPDPQQCFLQSRIRVQSIRSQGT